MEYKGPVARGAALGISITLVLGLAVAVLLSNVAVFQGPLGGGVLTVSDINSGGILGEPGGVLSFQNNTSKPFNFLVTNTVNRTVNYNLTLHFFLDGIVNGGFTVLSFDWSVTAISIGTVVLDNTPSVNTTTSWFESVPDVLGPFASYAYTVNITFSWVGAGSFTFEAWVSDGTTA